MDRGVVRFDRGAARGDAAQEAQGMYRRCTRRRDDALALGKRDSGSCKRRVSGFRPRNGLQAHPEISSAAYEAWPPQERPALHEVFLSGWGLPIGETFDLRELAEHCQRLNRWSFFFTSMVLNVPGGIASPANAQAFL
jgi:hypothetical protein